MGLRVVLLPYPLSVLNPDWVVLLLLFWSTATRGELGVLSAWITGMIVDMMTGSHLGQHALSYTILVYLSVHWGKRLLFYAVPQQVLSVLGLLAVNQLLLLWTQDAHLEGVSSVYYWLAAFSGALLWPLISLLDRPRSVRIRRV